MSWTTDRAYPLQPSRAETPRHKQYTHRKRASNTYYVTQNDIFSIPSHTHTQTSTHNTSSIEPQETTYFDSMISALPTSPPFASATFGSRFERPVLVDKIGATFCGCAIAGSHFEDGTSADVIEPLMIVFVFELDLILGSGCGACPCGLKSCMGGMSNWGTSLDSICQHAVRRLSY